MIVISRLVVGALLLVLGRRLYWLFVAAVGFFAGLEVAPRFFPDRSHLVVLIIAVVMALIGALLAVLATKVVLAIAGFAAAAGVAIALLSGAGIESDAVRLAAYVIAGVVGAILMLVLFDWALIVLSSLAGAGLITLSLGPLLELPPGAVPFVGIALAVVGIVIQAGFFVRRTPPPRPRRS